MTGSTVQHDPGLRITALICEQDLSNTMPRTECNVDDGHKYTVDTTEAPL